MNRRQFLLTATSFMAIRPNGRSLSAAVVGRQVGDWSCVIAPNEIGSGNRTLADCIRLFDPRQVIDVMNSPKGEKALFTHIKPA